MKSFQKYNIGDVYQFKKPHPCGGNGWEMIRYGVDCKLRCTTCERVIIVPRIQLEKRIRKILYKEKKPE